MIFDVLRAFLGEDVVDVPRVETTSELENRKPKLLTLSYVKTREFGGSNYEQTNIFGVLCLYTDIHVVVDM